MGFNQYRYWLCPDQLGKLSEKNKWTVAVFFAGMVLISLVLSIHFADKAFGA